uniref:Uncharacterized protein n=1 Tax=Nelumbo nucifera TaxID=4432 RepID=A0A822YGZ6_NELNU|nr:TPA_asm: hypothetical protein HUJ06_010563 [Nelumbo nucifera]
MATTTDYMCMSGFVPSRSNSLVCTALLLLLTCSVVHHVKSDQIGCIAACLQTFSACSLGCAAKGEEATACIQGCLAPYMMCAGQCSPSPTPPPPPCAIIK